jgi:hypothetical protein
VNTVLIAVRLEIFNHKSTPTSLTSTVEISCDRLMSEIDDSPYYAFVALCIVVIVVSLIKIAASNENIECFRKYFAVGYRVPDPNLSIRPYFLGHRHASFRVLLI